MQCSSISHLPKEIISQNSLEIEKNNVPNLPSELIKILFSFLDAKSLSICSLVSLEWKQFSSDKELWSKIFENFDLYQLQNYFFNMDKVEEYRKLSVKLTPSNRFGAAIAACEKSAKLDAHTDACGFRDISYAFRDISEVACKVKDYKTAMHCQMLAQQYFAVVGHEAMSLIIKCQVADANFLENSDRLINMAIALIDGDREFGLQALIAIAKKFADLQMFDEAMKYTQLGRTLRSSRNCRRGRDQRDDIHSFTEMGKHMLSLKQYKLSEECARKLDPHYFYPEWLYADILVKQIQEENFVNESLFSKIKFGTAHWITASEGLVFGLIDHGRYEEAKNIAKLRLKVEWSFGMPQFEKRLNEILTKLEMDVNLWLA